MWGVPADFTTQQPSSDNEAAARSNGLVDFFPTRCP